MTQHLTLCCSQNKKLKTFHIKALSILTDNETPMKAILNLLILNIKSNNHLHSIHNHYPWTLLRLFFFGSSIKGTVPRHSGPLVAHHNREDLKHKTYTCHTDDVKKLYVYAVCFFLFIINYSLFICKHRARSNLSLESLNVIR